MGVHALLPVGGAELPRHPLASTFGRFPALWYIAEAVQPRSSAPISRNGFENPFGMELLATVHRVGTREGAATLERAIEKTYA